MVRSAVAVTRALKAPARGLGTVRSAEALTEPARAPAGRIAVVSAPATVLRAATEAAGLIEVVKRYSVGRIIETGIADTTADYEEWHKIIKEKNIPIVYALAGQKIKIGDDFVLEILFPSRSLVGQSFSNTNSSSIVSKLSYGKNTFLFTGDAEEATEYFLVVTGEEVDSDILDVGHHGSKNSTGQEFLEAVSPSAAVIQVGRNNRYGHPAQETLDKLKDIKILRTDLEGDIDFSCDLEKCAVSSNSE